VTTSKMLAVMNLVEIDRRTAAYARVEPEEPSLLESDSRWAVRVTKSMDSGSALPTQTAIETVSATVADQGEAAEVAEVAEVAEEIAAALAHHERANFLLTHYVPQWYSLRSSFHCGLLPQLAHRPFVHLSTLAELDAKCTSNSAVRNDCTGTSYRTLSSSSHSCCKRWVSGLRTLVLCLVAGDLLRYFDCGRGQCSDVVKDH
jgi:hypothetical protein